MRNVSTFMRNVSQERRGVWVRCCRLELHLQHQGGSLPGRQEHTWPVRTASQVPGREVAPAGHSPPGEAIPQEMWVPSFLLTRSIDFSFNEYLSRSPVFLSSPQPGGFPLAAISLNVIRVGAGTPPTGFKLESRTKSQPGVCVTLTQDQG